MKNKTETAREDVPQREDRRPQGPLTARSGTALWFTGLPGSGKSTLALAVREALAARGVEAELLQMDVRRKVYTPRLTYTDEERELAYALFVEEAAELAARGALVLLDASGPKLAMRRAARERIGRFAEVHLRCRPATAMAREAARPEGRVMAGLYAKAMARKVTGRDFPGLGQVIGVDVPFEEDPGAELVLEADRADVAALRDKVLERFEGWWPDPVHRR
ncbi:Adenylyl-sulfate kinase [Fundidesulfovibrio magnetotacticus]|uniref:Adenylyl-sulfate kinase n=1 Tax=Fundidesulfovibrio magnetotacticus TaxID=2730080 RepID=A0A6V8LU55_9BACT|nr:adenylyl-sulfate kinase [Fundidesulfovibrio magnetotacticus]GFK93177.1 Adenylyl-sulfate kinase [Fundidesulfovibrio magnetotacticus]